MDENKISSIQNALKEARLNGNDKLTKALLIALEEAHSMYKEPKGA